MIVRRLTEIIGKPQGAFSDLFSGTCGGADARGRLTLAYFSH